LCFIIAIALMCYSLNVLFSVYPIFIGVLSIISACLSHRITKQLTEDRGHSVNTPLTQQDIPLV